MTIDRRTFLAAGSATMLGSLAMPAIVGRALAADTLKIGSLLDTSGIFDAYGKPMDMALQLAVDQINAGGGLNGQQVEIVSYDTQSDMALYTQYAQKLVRQDKVDVVHGGILSASREAIRQTLHKANILYFYNVLYEGGVCDRNICIDGVTPAQQVEVLMPAAIKKWGRKIYILAADYNYGQITARWMKKYGEDAGGEADPFFEVAGGLAELVEDGNLLFAGEAAFGHERRDVGAVAEVGGDAAGGGVGVGDVALIFEESHLVADRGRGEAKGMALDKRLRTDGLRREDVVIDDECEDTGPTI